MVFMVHYEVEPQNRDMSSNRALAIGGETPSGVKILQSWTSIAQLEGWVVVESSDVIQLGKYLRQWSNLNVQRIIPIVDDEAQREIMTSKL